MSQPPFRSKPTSSSPRRLLTPQERFGVEPEVAPDLSLVGEETGDSATGEHEIDANDPFAPYVRPTLHTRTHSPRRHELKPHSKRPHELRRHEVKRLERERHEPVGTAGRGPMVSGDVPVRQGIPRKRASKFLVRFLGLAFVLFVAYCGVAAFSAPQFAVKNVQVEGLHDTPQEKVEALTHPLVGQNFFRANRAGVERQVSALPTVASARVVRAAGWPPRLRVIVSERRPILKVGAGDKWWVVDQTGKAYREATAADASLYALTAPQFEPKTGQVLNAKWWPRALELQKALSSDNALANGVTPENAKNGQSQGTGSASAPFWQLRRLYLDKHGMASIRVSGRGALRQHGEMLIRLGESEWTPKLARARVALSYFERTGRNAQELDLVSYTYPTWRAKAEDDSQDSKLRIGLLSGTGEQSSPSSEASNG